MRFAVCMVKRILLAALVAILLLTGATGGRLLSAARADETPTNGMVRVFLSSLGGGIKQVDVTVYGSYSLDGTSATAIPSGTQLTVDMNAATGELTLTRNGVSTSMGKGFTLRRHESDGNSGLTIAQARTTNLYPASLEFYAHDTGGSYKLYTLAHVFIEDYLYGVLPYEMGYSAPLEALKAQCVSARTYTLRAMQTRTDNIYDVVDTTNDQVYNGTPTGAERCMQAVDETRGLVLKYGSNLVGSYYTASNGGQIDAISNIWGSTQYSYIRVKDDPYDYENPHATVRSFTVVKNGAQSSQTLAQLLVNKAKTVFGATNVSILSVDNVLPHTPRYPIPSRLYTKMDFDVTVSCDGAIKSGTLTFDIFSELEGALNMSINVDDNEIWSVVKSDVGYTVQSRRFGHGTGMSQRGAMTMAEKGYPYDEIIAFYYEGCSLEGYVFNKRILSALTTGASSEIVTAVWPVSLSNTATGTAVVELSDSKAELALRVQASAGADVIMGIPHGAVLAVHSVQENWCFVSYGGMYGYVYRDALALSGKADGKTAAVPVLEAYGRVKNGSYLNLRSGEGTGYNIVAEVPSGTVLPLLNINNGWAYTQYGREAGYVSMDYITRTDRYDGPAGDGDNAGAQVTAPGGVKMFTLPKTNGYSAMTLPEGVLVKLKHTDGSWAEVYYAGVTGFVPMNALARNNISVEEIKDRPTGNEQYAVVVSTASSLNMRDDDSMAGSIMLEIPRGETLIVTDEIGEWCAVRYRGMTGYCMKKYLVIGTTDGDNNGERLQARVTTESGSLNLRKSESKTSAILTTIPRNTVIYVLKRGVTWSQVTYNGKTGFVMNDYLTFLNDGTQTQPTVAPATIPPVVTPTPKPPVVTPTPVPTPSGGSTIPTKARVTTASGSLNLRKYASTSASILTSIPQYQVIEVLGIEGTWTHVRYNGKTGYVMSVFLSYLNNTESTQPPAVTPTPVPPTEEEVYARVTTASGPLNLRKNASTNSALLAKIPQNAIIQVLKKLGTWTQVNYNGKEGYVMTTFLTFIENSDTPVTPPSGSDQPSTDTTLMAQVTTQTGSLNLRKNAASNATILTTIPQYSYIQVLSRGDTWSKVTYKSYTGYVKSSFLTFVSTPAAPPSSGQPDDQAETPWARVTTESGSLNLRASASTTARILDTIPRHAIISVLEKGSVWSRVSYDGLTGYVKNSFLTFLHEHPNQGNAGGSTPTVPASPNDMRDATMIELASVQVVKALPAGASATLRVGCSHEADALAVILRGEYVVVSAVGEAWCRIEYEGVQGYLPAEILDI